MGALDGSVEEKADNGSPEDNGDAECAEDGADGDKDGAFWRARLLHEWRVLGIRDAGWRIGRDGQDAGERGQVRQTTTR